MSLGMRSGVNCTRENVSSSACATVWTSSVLASPGTPTSSAWPPASSAATRLSTTVVLPDDALGDLRDECAAGARELVEQLDVAFIARGGGASGSRRSHDRNVVGDDRESVPGWRRAGPTLVSIAGTGVAGSGNRLAACPTRVLYGSAYYGSAYYGSAYYGSAKTARDSRG